MAAAAAHGGAGAGAAAGSPLFPFVFVGCWNQPAATSEEDNKTPRNAVAEEVSKMADIQYIVLGGDNVYPRPNVEKKHDPKVFDEGITLYEVSRKPILGSFGNHNVDTLGHQMTKFGLSETYYHREFAGDIHLLVLDTNIMNDKPEPGAEAPNVNAAAKAAAAETAYTNMLTWFHNRVRDLPAGHQYFVVQHEPYFTARVKKGVDKLLQLRNSSPFLDIMFGKAPIAVLCADTHYYQHATLGKVEEAAASPVIHQFIVGTGGASPDAHMPGFIDTRVIGGYTYTNVKEEPGYGFLVIRNPDPSRFEFHKVLDWPATVKGGARRTRKRSKAQRRSRKQKLHRKRR